MKTLLVLFAVAFCAIQCSPSLSLGVGLVGPFSKEAILQGPFAKGTVIGPDGSVVSGGGQAGLLATSAIPGGAVTAAFSPGIVAAPVAAPVLVPAPVAVSFGLTKGLGSAILVGPSETVISDGLGKVDLGIGAVGIGGIGGIADIGAIGDIGINDGCCDDDGDDGSYKPSGKW